MLLYIGDFSFSVVHYLYIDMQLILYIVNPTNVLNSLVRQRFDGGIRVLSILIVSCHSQMIVILLLHIQFEYFLFFLADLHSVVLQLHSDQE